jgi:hypothetical protein
VKDVNSKPPAEAEATGTSDSANRRRTGRVVHDDRGCASVEWHDAPVNQPRTVLEIEDPARAQRRLKGGRDGPTTKAPREDSFNPYQRTAGATPAPGPRRDLRKLSKWIKLMREFEARKELDKEAAKKPAEE